ncbi:hypothetical protein D3I60_00595 [Brevibacterium permense]|uniref:xylulokinase n=1 Tax=Brevibacterium permense TaxID=234834 RepID=UPI0021CFF9E1|nr:FGGY family carbohydrate kinase [Brevibacterium permense]MCU4295593.1 hypothetical protein [Brevibacterium permense]
MSMEILLGIDVGTSGVKVVASSMDGRMLRDSVARYPTTVRQDGDGAEQDAEVWWSTLLDICSTVVAGDPVAAVAVTSQAPTLVPIDACGVAAGPALTWLDRRAVGQGERIENIAPGHRHGGDPFFGTAKLAWVQEERPEIAVRTAQVLSANGFIAHRLTGAAALDDSTASLMQAFDEASGRFDERLTGAGFGLELLPEVVPTTQIIGTVTSAASSLTGIPAGTPVAAGAIDSIGSALEAGALEVGDPLVEMSGFSSVTILPVPGGTRVPGFIHSRHCVPGVDLLITAQVTAGATVDWLNRTAGGEQDLRELGPLQERSRPSRLTFVPALAGERTPSWNQRTRGLIDGIDLGSDGVDLMLAAMEGNALALATDLRILHEHGFEVPRILSTGGGSASDVWMQIKADVLQVEAARPRTGHGAAHGAAFLGGLAIGRLDIADIRGFSGEIRSRFTPDVAMREAYERKLERFGRLLEVARDR